MEVGSRLQAFVTQVAAKHGMDLDEIESELWLSNQGLTFLIARCWAPTVVSVQLGYARGNELACNPRVVLFSGAGDWEAVEYTRAEGETLACALLSPDQTELKAICRQSQVLVDWEAAALLSSLQDQDWIAEGVLIEPDRALIQPPAAVLEALDLGSFALRQLRVWCQWPQRCERLSDTYCPQLCTAFEVF